VTRNDKDTNHNEQLERKTRQRPEIQTSFAEIGAKNDQNRIELFNSIGRMQTLSGESAYAFRQIDADGPNQAVTPLAFASAAPYRLGR
jgi:hypothetical protein